MATVSKLSLPNLLSYLQVDDRSGETGIIQLCREAEALRRRRRYDKAIAVATSAAQLAYTVHNHDLHGVTLLYLSLARLSQGTLDERERAIRDCEKAMTAFYLKPHNHAIAQIFRAEIDRHVGNRDEDEREKWRQAALVHFRQAANNVQSLAKYHQARGQLEKAKEYQDLGEAIDLAIVELMNALVAVEPIRPAPKRRREPEAQPHARPEGAEAAINLGEPTRLIWNAAEPNRPLPVPLNTPFVVFDSQAIPNPPSGPAGALAIGEFAIAGRFYTLRQITADANGRQFPGFRQGEPYYTVRIAGNGKNVARGDEYVLVKLQDPPFPPGQLLAGTLDGKRGERHWAIRDGSEETMYRNEEIRIMGVADAVFTPGSVHNAHLEELLSCIDDLYAAENMHPELGQGFRAIRDKFHTYLRNHYDLEPLLIEPGQTLFNPSLGHRADGFEHRDDVPEDIILRVIGGGYRRSGVPFREARVIVNR